MIKAFLFDLDGVFYVDDNLIPGANDALQWLQERNIPYRFITNNTTLPRNKLVEKLNKIGMQVNEDDLISANYAGVLLLKKLKVNSCKLVLREIAQADYQSFNTNTSKPEAIVIGDIGPHWDYKLMNELMDLILAGAQLIALHKGRYFQTEKGLAIDSGAFVAGLEHATETKALVVGKPQPTFFELATQVFTCKPTEISMVGDDLINDILGGQKMGYPTFLVKTGKFRESLYQASDIRPEHLIPSIATLPNYLSTNNLI